MNRVGLRWPAWAGFAMRALFRRSMPAAIWSALDHRMRRVAVRLALQFGIAVDLALVAQRGQLVILRIQQVGLLRFECRDLLLYLRIFFGAVRPGHHHMFVQIGDGGVGVREARGVAVENVARLCIAAAVDLRQRGLVVGCVDSGTVVARFLRAARSDLR